MLDDYLDAIYTQRIARTDLHEGLFREYFERLRGAAEAGWGKRFREAASREEFEIFQRIQDNLRDFAGHKQASLTQELRGFLVDRTGKKRTLEAWKKEIGKTLKRHNDRYLRAELQAATAGAQAAESWQHFERRKYLYPNLKYITAHDERVRESHRALDGTVRPVDDPFWDVYYPPNGWNCRCKVIQTDEGITPGADIDFDPPKGFRGNVGKTGQLFGEDHPYFMQTALDGERLRTNAKTMHARITRDEVRAWTKENEVEIRLPHLDKAVTMTQREAKRVTGKGHRNAPTRNELLYVLSVLAGDLRYFGSKQDNGDNPQVRAWHYYGVTLAGVDYILNLWNLLLDDGAERIGIASITNKMPDFGGP